jgi:hypothetical protein
MSRIFRGLLHAFVLTLVSLAAHPAWAQGRARTSSPSELHLAWAPGTFSNSEQDRADEILHKVEGLLPAKIRTTLTRQITIRLEALDAAPGIFVPACLGDAPENETQKQVLGKVSHSVFADRRRISELTLHRGFKAEILGGESTARTYECGHRNLYRLAIASIIHELGHIYDDADPRTFDEQAQVQACIEADRDAGETSNDPEFEAVCRQLRNRRTVTTQPAFLDLMGFTETGVLFRKRKQGNHSTLRSPDPYEFTNERESFAVNLEYFVMDPEFGCRRPAVQDYYSRHFGYDPHLGRACRVNTVIPISSGYAGGPQIQANLDPSRIYQIHALFAGKGPQTMSRWGHSLFRIVLCAPERKEPGPECMNDVAHHVAISFRANVPDSAISYIKGLKGDYDSMIFAQPFLGVIEEYNKGEFRELVSLPLRLTDDQKRLFVLRVLEASWEYAGRYKFISNNCAVEALNFLKGTLGESELSDRHPLTPIGLNRLLKQLNLVDASSLGNLDQAVQSGNYYASKKPEVERAFHAVMESFARLCRNERSAAFCTPNLPSKLDDYLSDTQASQRMLAYASFFKDREESPEIARRTMGARFFLLESYVIRRSEKAAMELLSSVIEGGKWERVPEEARSEIPRIKELVAKLRLLQQQGLPALARSEGYGIPLSQTSPAAASNDDEKKISAEVVAWARSAFARTFAELDSAQKNRVFFLQEMRKPIPSMFITQKEQTP